MTAEPDGLPEGRGGSPVPGADPGPPYHRETLEALRAIDSKLGVLLIVEFVIAGIVLVAAIAAIALLVR